MSQPNQPDKKPGDMGTHKPSEHKDDHKQSGAKTGEKGNAPKDPSHKEHR